MSTITVLMFGWEFPPHISGGLGTACFGLTKSLIEEKTSILFVVPKAHGDETIGMIDASEILVSDDESNPDTHDHVSNPDKGQIAVDCPNDTVTIAISAAIVPYLPAQHWTNSPSISNWNYEIPARPFKETRSNKGRKYNFTGTYGPSLLEEVERYSEVASAIGHRYAFDVIHAHDWITYLAGIEAKKISGKPLIVHVHATEYDRAEEHNIDPTVFNIEQRGMREADCIIAVSRWTKNIIVSKYDIHPDKVKVVHNGVISGEVGAADYLPKIAEHVVTFLGRITWQKGPQYFVEAARKILQHFPDAHFIMAGSGDLLSRMIEMVATFKMSDRFHFTGFLRGKQMSRVWNVSDVYVMPSVSEPFGITPLEAIQAGVPVIVSNQSGVAEVIDHAIKVDFWDTDSLADSIMGVLRHKSLSTSLTRNSKKELASISWRRAARQINAIYHGLHSRTAALH
ncbi:MAG TPA: glycosyltransferase [Chryseosolibacter sp.]|nr:glycosyltransferase [Chryseosolibacter sp.]